MDYTTHPNPLIRGVASLPPYLGQKPADINWALKFGDNLWDDLCYLFADGRWFTTTIALEALKSLQVPTTRKGWAKANHAAWVAPIFRSVFGPLTKRHITLILRAALATADPIHPCLERMGNHWRFTRHQAQA